jgi:hypothetical protein
MGRSRYALVSILHSLLSELQDRLASEQTNPTAAEVAEAAESERLNVTLPSGVIGRLKRQALDEGRSCSSLATFLIEDGLRRHSSLT